MDNLNSILGRLEVLTDLTEFADKQNAKKSNFTAGWCPPEQYMKWVSEIYALRQALPKEVLKDFDEERKNQGHRDDCGCLLCEERRGDS